MGAGFGGSGFGGGPWGGSSFAFSGSGVVYDVGLSDTAATSDQTLANSEANLTFIAGAVSASKVEIQFSLEMSVDWAFLNPFSYVITEVLGGTSIGVQSVIPMGDRRAVLQLDTELHSKDYYFITISTGVQSLGGGFAIPNTHRFQWVDMTLPVHGVPLVIPIGSFSGEVSGGILGNPDGLVFFSPAYTAVGATSTIEVESVSACTQASDEYHLPVTPPAPVAIATFGGPTPTVLNSSAALWTPADFREVRMGLAVGAVDNLPSPTDYLTTAVLVETIAITAGGFLNDARWKTYPGIGATVFTTANNLAPIGPGPTTPVKLDWPKVYVGDSVPATDQVATSLT